jgi:hypothetical protein
MVGLTHDELKAALSYDHQSGEFRWLVGGLRFKAGDVAGFPGGKGYWQIRIGGTAYYGHRLAWLYVHGGWPCGALDHIDGNRRNNRIENLRLATISQNAANQRKRNGKSSAFKGVSWHAARGKWSAHIRINGKSKYLGQFDTEEEAHRRYVAAAKWHFGEYARVS